MAIEGIKISLGEVSQVANTIRTINQGLNVRLEEIKKEINSLSASWQSDAANTFKTKFNSMLPVFDDYKVTIDSYAKFLDATVVAGYDATETGINNSANSFR
jgi:WXG100 family type VII secretion target